MAEQKYLVFTDRELQLLHWCVEHHAPREAFGTEENLELVDLESRLATALEGK